MVRVIRLAPNEEKIIEGASGGADLRTAVSKQFGIKEQDFELVSIEHDTSGEEAVVLIKEKGSESQLAATHAAQAPFMKIDMDITPDVDLLIHNGEGYDMVTALSELIDNSIQNTANNTASERLISINFIASDVPTNIEEIRVWDNGTGMTVEGVKQWGILGRTHHLRRLSSTPVNQVAGREQKSSLLTSDFSRYGVGSKKAVFSLGDTVTVTTRTQNSPWVCECTLSKDTIKETGWSTSLSLRLPTHEEVNHSSFTCFSVTGLAETHRCNFSEEFVASWLGHIYHYYIYGSKGNILTENDNSGEEDEEDDEEQPTTTIPGSVIELLVNGKNLRHHPSIDGETVLLNKGVERLAFNIPLVLDKVKNTNPPSSKKTPGTMIRPAPGRGDDPEEEIFSQATQKSVSDKKTEQASVNPSVSVVLFYYPFKDGLETMPIPAGVHIDEGIDDERLPLCDRRPGMEFFWNGRMLPRDFLDLSTWSFLKNCLSPSSQISHSGNGVDRLPPACYRRVKGQIFLDSSFEVTANKHSLNRESVLAKALLRFSHRTLSQKIRRWITECHRRHDEELIFGSLDKNMMRGDGTCYYTEVKVSSMNLSKGLFILTKQPNGRGKLIGKIKAIFRSPDSEAYHGCFVTMLVSFSSTHNSVGSNKTQDGALVSIPIGLVQKTLTAQEAESELQKVRKSNPTKMVLGGSLIDAATIDGTPSKKNEFQTTATLVAGIHDSEITIKLVNDSGKVIGRKGSQLEVSVAATPVAGSCLTTPLISTYSCTPKTAGEFVIGMNTIKESHKSFLSFTGKYVFAFRSSLVTLPTTELVLQVLPSLEISKFSPLSEQEVEITGQLGKPLPQLSFELKDEFSNSIPYDLLPKDHSIAVSILERGDTPIESLKIDSESVAINSTPHGFIVSEVVVSGVLPVLTASGTMPLDLKTTLTVARPAGGKKTKKKDKKPQVFTHRSHIDSLKAGRPIKMTVAKMPESIGWREAFFMSMQLIDEWGNPTSTVGNTAAGSQVMCRLTAIGKAEISNKKKDVVCGLTASSSLFEFSDISMLPLEDLGLLSDTVEITIQAVVFYRLKSRDKKTSITATCTVSVRPPTSYPHFVLECASNGVDHGGALETHMKAIDVGEDLTGLKAELVHPPSWAKKSVVTCSWATDSSVAFTEEGEKLIAMLPDIVAPTKVSKVTHELLTTSPDDSSECVRHKLLISYQKGSPSEIIITQHPATTPSGSSVPLQFRIADKFGNVLKVDDSRIAKVRFAKFEIADEDPNTPKSERTTIKTDGELKKRDTTWTLQDCLFEGKAKALSIIASVSVQGKTLFSKPFSMEVIPGEAAFITVDGQKSTQKKPFSITKHVNFDCIPPLRIGLIDSFGNDCPVGGKRIALNCKDKVKLIQLPEKLAGSQHDGRAGVFTPPLLVAAQPGTISGSVQAVATASFEKMTQLEPAVIKLTIKPGKIPWDARIPKKSDGGNRTVTAGTAFSENITATILCEDQTDCTTIPSDRVSLEITSAVLHSPIRFRGPSEPSQVAVKACQVRFPELQNYTPTAAGTYTGRVDIDLNYHPHRDYLEKLKCIRRLVDTSSSRFTFEVLAAAPNRLNCRLLKAEKPSSKKKSKKSHSDAPPYGSWSDTHHVGAVSGGKSLILGAEVRAEDLFGNVVCSLNGIELTYSIEKYTDNPCSPQVKRKKNNELVPKISEVQIISPLSNGITTIPSMSLHPDSPDEEAPEEGTYALKINASLPDSDQLLSAQVIFHYTDNAAKEKAMVLLATRRSEWVNRQRYLENKIQKIEARRAAIDEIEDNWDSRIREVQKEMLATKKLKSPNWATFDATELAKQTATALRNIERQAAEEGGSDAMKKRKKNFGYERSQGLKIVADRRNCSSEIIGCITEFGFVRDEPVDICISKSLGRFMQTIVLATSTETASLKRDLSKHGSLPLLALDNFNHAPLNSEGRIASLTPPNPRPQGWIGYAANIIDIEERNNYLRPVFFNLLGNKVVFDTIGNARTWRQQLLAKNIKAPPIICLDGEKMEQSGIEWAGQQAPDLGFRFGTMSPCSTERYKSIQKLHKLLETYADLQEERMQEKNQRTQLETLQQREGTLRGELRDVSQTIKTISRLLDTDPSTVSGSVLAKLIDEAPPAPSQAVPAPDDKKRRALSKRPATPAVSSDDEDESTAKIKRTKHKKGK